jgi:glutamate synthase domain-containing protein 2/glutamate synthase domain-containing protein 1/glutamate synthase domain-containing protein 3
VPFPRTERSACGVGFVASTANERRRDIVDQGLRGLECVEHRGGCLADRKTGDGAGLMTEIPFDVLGIEPGDIAVGTLFVNLPPSEENRAFDVYQDALRARGLRVADRRAVPVDTSVLGRQARQTLPRIHQIFVPRPSFCRTEASFGALLYQAKQAAKTAMREAGYPGAHFSVSLSPKTIVYKALTRSHDLRHFYDDLRDPAYRSRFALFHRRFSTNTRTSWDKVQPFRMVAHNGEINTIESNRAWSYSREQALGLPSEELLTHQHISDSGNLNEMVEALRWRSSIPHLSEILAIMVPPAAAQSNAFYKFWSRAVEPWDGPAFLAFSDGDIVGSRLDRNGFRPGRWVRTHKSFYLASEAGLFDITESEILAKGALHGGSGVHVELDTGEVHFRDPSESRENFNATFDPRLEKAGADEVTLDRDVLENANLFRLTKEELEEILVPMIKAGKEPVGSMGDTARLAVMSDQPRPFFDFFFQNFAQVTNPPLDHLRERLITDLSCYLGRRPNVFAPKTLLPVTPGLELDSPVLTPERMAYVRRLGATSPNELCFESVEVDAVFRRVQGPAGLALALDDLAEKVLAAIRGGCSIVVLTDRRAKYEAPPIPSLLALQAASRVLTDHGHRLDASIVVEAGDARTTHHVAALVGFGAAAVCPYLAFEVARRPGHRTLEALDPPTRSANLQRALDEGLLKIMSKMGISTVQGYQNSKLFTTIGLHQSLLDRYFRGLTSVIGGLDLEAPAQRILDETERDRTHEPTDLLNSYLLREHRKGQTGEAHNMTAGLTKLAHEFCADHSGELARWDAYESYLAQCAERGPVALRDLWQLVPVAEALPLEDVQPRKEVWRRFGTGAMSFGAISAESQRDLVHGMRRIGARSSSGEGGENPFYWEDGTTASVKQVASGRFGVTAEYLMVAEEIEIKIAQGAKPGEGGQLMGIKVDEAIAKARHASIGVDLISPPPLHDIYSIEDLRQLIYELKQLKPGVKVSVKLVSGAHVGTIAAGVVKAGADVVQISGGDGGTGAASISSMKHAGLPWEVGLADAHQTLLDEGLRGHCVLRVDGGLRHGEDIVKAACLGAEQFGFGKLVLVAEGCIMARVCQKNTCPRGIATHDPKFKKKYRGSPDDVVALMTYLAEDVRRHLARMGLHSLEEAVGRGEGLRRDAKSFPTLDLSRLHPSAPHPGGTGLPALDEPTHRLNQRLVEDVQPALSGERSVELTYDIESVDRGILATASGRMALARRAARLGEGPEPCPVQVHFRGSAGQGFAAFLAPGFTVQLWGEANDSVGKSMSGGCVVVRPPSYAPYAPEENTIIGNGALYGATGGEVFINGLAGDRFAVRNSGATAVLEGAGLHACEYMTNGTVLILGPVSFNVGAGMTGGVLYMRREAQPMVNQEYLRSEELTPEDEAVLRDLLQRHHQLTGSRRARTLLDDLGVLQKFQPKAIGRASPREALTARA